MLYENGMETKSIAVNSKSITYSNKLVTIINNTVNNTLSIVEGFASEEYDLDNLSYEDRRNLDARLKSIDSNVSSYYNRILPKQSLESLFL